MSTTEISTDPNGGPATRDIAVVGAGLVGLAAALAFAEAGLDVVLLGAAMPPSPTDRLDNRIYAISPGSAALIDRLGAWELLQEARVQPVHGMAVFGDRPGATLQFDALESGVPALAHIVESGVLAAALAARVAVHDRIEVRIPSRPVALQVTDREALIRLEAGPPVAARLVVGADGAQSWVRQVAGFDVSTRSYPQTAVVANFLADVPHGGIARQWFRDDGVLALLPLPGGHVSMVWSATPAVAEDLMDLSPEDLAIRVAAAATGALGTLTCVTPASSFPLRAMAADRFVMPRLALVGDAAHNVHPLAGQGVNLGFRDVRELAAVLEARGSQRDCGVLPLLRRYERARREDVRTMIAVTDGLQRLFSSRLPGAGWLRNAGLRLTAGLPMIRQGLAQHALA